MLCTWQPWRSLCLSSVPTTQKPHGKDTLSGGRADTRDTPTAASWASIDGPGGLTRPRGNDPKTVQAKIAPSYF